MTQIEMILNHIERYGSITGIEAVNEYGIMRLASRVNEMRKAGINIVGETEISKNRYGDNVRYKRYRRET